MQWYAIRTKSNRESVVLASLQGKDLEAFLPTFQKSSPRGCISAPLFPGYLFCRFDVHRRQPVVITPGVAYIVSNGKIPLPVDEAEISSLKNVIAAKTPVECHEFVPIGQVVWIQRGPLAGTCGRIIDRKQDRLVVSISLLQRSVSVSICPEWLEPEYGAVRVA
jgi:transcription antitermination factor NusG